MTGKPFTPFFREHFLGQELDTRSAVPPPNTNCTICFEPFKDPVETRCKHFFCRKCITGWMTNAADVCPICRKEFYPVSPVLTMVGEEHLDAKQRFDRASQALDLSKLTFGHMRDGKYQFDTFDMCFDGSISPTGDATQLVRASTKAAQFLATPPHERGAKGPTYIDEAVLTTHLIAIGNIVLGMAEMDLKPFNAGKQSDLSDILRTMYACLTTNPQKYATAHQIAAYLRNDVTEFVRSTPSVKRSYNSLMAQRSDPNDPIRLITSYIAAICAQTYESLPNDRKEAVDQKRGKASGRLGRSEQNKQTELMRRPLG